MLLYTMLFSISCRKDDADTASSASEWAPSDKEPVAVETAPVRSEAFFQGIEASGILEGIREADVVSETSGIIKDVLFEIGDYVEQGDLLLTVENDLMKTNLEYSRQELKTARLEFEAVEKSYKTGGTSLVAYNQSMAKRKGARYRFEQAEDAYENTRIRAPFAGFISTRDSAIIPGSSLSPGVAVTHIVDTSSFQIRLSVGEEAVSQVLPGAAATVFVNALPGKTIEAFIRAVSPGSGRSSGRFPVVVQWENADNLPVKSGMSARVLLQPETGGEKELVAPSSALVFRNGLSYVFRVAENTAEPVQVDVLRILGNRASLQGDIRSGDSVIVSGLNSLAPGDPVLPRPVD